MSEVKKKRGRPKGSKNRVYAEAVEIPASCQMCGSSDLVIIDSNRRLIREIDGVLPNGHRFNRVRWDRKKCKNCGQLVAVRKYYVENNNRKPIRSSETDSTLPAIAE